MKKLPKKDDGTAKRLPKKQLPKISKAPQYDEINVRSVSPGLPKVNYSVPDSTFYRVDRATGRVEAVITVTPDGLSLGWDTCGTCVLGVNACKCSSGVTVGSGIMHIYVSRGGIKPVAPEKTNSAPVFVPPVARKLPKKVKALPRLPKADVFAVDATEDLFSLVDEVLKEVKTLPKKTLPKKTLKQLPKADTKRKLLKSV